MKIAILGTSGMLGSMVAEYFYLYYCPNDLTFFSRTVDSKKWPGIKKLEIGEHFTGLKDAHTYDYIINCVGVIRQIINESNKSDRIDAFVGNVSLPYYLANKVDGHNTQVLQIATDCVFSGHEPIALLESSPHDPTDWYGKTKSLGEVASDNFHHIRTSICGPEIPPNQKSLMEWFLHQPPNAKINGYTNHLWNGTTTLGFTKLCYTIITKNIKLAEHIHFVHIPTITKYEMLKTFAKVFDREDITINSVEAPQVVYRALTPEHREFNDYLIKEMGYDNPTFENLIKELKNETKNSSVFRKNNKYKCRTGSHDLFRRAFTL
jgi:dTDP-4-dehydrorhamnose reductase